MLNVIQNQTLGSRLQGDGLTGHRHWPKRIAVCVLVILTSRLSAQPTPDSSVSQDDAPTRLQITSQLDDLASESYARRNAAMSQLIDAGPSAIELISQEIKNSSEAEVQLRALDVLKTLADREIAERDSPAVDALERLANSDDPILARRANTRLDGVAEQRRDYAVKRLQELGATVDGDSWRQKMIVGRGMITQRIDLDSTVWHGTAEDAQLISELGDVGEVRFSGPQITDRYLEPLKELTGLVIVYISRTSVTDEGIAKLKQCPDLARVVLRYTDLTDASIESLAQMNVHSIDIIGTQITMQAVEDLEERVPGIKVEYKAGAYLGVGADNFQVANDKGCRLTRIEPESAAAKAGLMVDDVIVSYGGKEITDFESLRKLIATNRPGEVVPVEWRRGKRVLKKDVTLGAWP